ncbi:MAG: ATP-binding protein [Phycisphaerae bacterium]|nr:ATP-binding protein [Saprospiraceae bacterium]
MIQRLLIARLQERLGRKKAILLLGPRQTGKTTLAKTLLADFPEKSLYLNADEPLDRERLTDASSAKLQQLTAGYDFVVIDEAQRVRNIGLTIKLMVDQFPEKQVLATGSSSLDLANTMNEPLTGRKFEFNLFPISWQEWSNHIGALEAERGLEQRLLYGMYPDVLNNPGDERMTLAGLTSGYLYKDLFAFGAIRKPEILDRLVKALALQLGNEVSYNELANTLKTDKETVSNYISLLEKAFIIFRLQPLSRNARREISTSRKIYFYDNGIRNMLIGNFNPLELRSDTGALWENFLVSERRKRNHYAGRFVTDYFWRTQAGQEIDYVEETDGQFEAFEFKWNPNRSVRFPKTFLDAYPNTPCSVVHRDNFLSFV